MPQPQSSSRDTRRSVVFVCLGNICRSPTAEGILRDLVTEAGLAARVGVDSAGTSAYHAGDSPDGRAAAAAAHHGVHLTGASRQFTTDDFGRFDYVIAMDAANLQNLRRLATNDGDASRLSLLRQWRPDQIGPDRTTNGDVPDPYYDADDGFETVFQICQDGCRGVLHTLRHQLSRP